MDCNTENEKKQEVFTSDQNGLATGLRDEAGYLIMPEAILESVGALGARLMGAIMDDRRPSQPEIFKPVEQIAGMAFLSVPTTRKLLNKSWDSGWLHYAGRQRPSPKRQCRRTATWVVTEKAWKARRPWHPWPKWMGRKPFVHFPPACHAVYSVILGRWCMIEHVTDEGIGLVDGREYMSITDIRELTGLSFNSVCRALAHLKYLIVDRGGWYDLRAVG